MHGSAAGSCPRQPPQQSLEAQAAAGETRAPGDCRCFIGHRSEAAAGYPERAVRNQVQRRRTRPRPALIERQRLETPLSARRISLLHNARAPHISTTSLLASPDGHQPPEKCRLCYRGCGGVSQGPCARLRTRARGCGRAAPGQAPVAGIAIARAPGRGARGGSLSGRSLATRKGTGARGAPRAAWAGRQANRERQGGAPPGARRGAARPAGASFKGAFRRRLARPRRRRGRAAAGAGALRAAGGPPISQGTRSEDVFCSAHQIRLGPRALAGRGRNRAGGKAPGAKGQGGSARANDPGPNQGTKPKGAAGGGPGPWPVPGHVPRARAAPAGAPVRRRRGMKGSRAARGAALGQPRPPGARGKAGQEASRCAGQSWSWLAVWGEGAAGAASAAQGARRAVLGCRARSTV